MTLELVEFCHYRSGMKLKLIAFSILLLSIVSCNTTDAQIEAWIKKNPDKVLEAIIDYQKKQQEENQPKPAMVKENAAQLFSDGSPSVGSGPIKIAYFFDFNCGHCARQGETNKAVIQKNPKVQIYYKNFPVLGPSSELAARAALAAHQQNKYKEFYEETFKTREKSQQTLSGIARKLKLDVKKWEADMNGEVVQKELDSVRALAEKMRIGGTPFLAIAPDKIFPGRVDQLADIVQSLN